MSADYFYEEDKNKIVHFETIIDIEPVQAEINLEIPKKKKTKIIHEIDLNEEYHYKKRDTGNRGFF